MFDTVSDAIYEAAESIDSAQLIAKFWSASYVRAISKLACGHRNLTAKSVLVAACWCDDRKYRGPRNVVLPSQLGDRLAGAILVNDDVALF